MYKVFKWWYNLITVFAIYLVVLGVLARPNQCIVCVTPSHLYLLQVCWSYCWRCACLFAAWVLPLPFSRQCACIMMQSRWMPMLLRGRYHCPASLNCNSVTCTLPSRWLYDLLLAFQPFGLLIMNETIIEWVHLQIALVVFGWIDGCWGWGIMYCMRLRTWLSGEHNAGGCSHPGSKNRFIWIRWACSAAAWSALWGVAVKCCPNSILTMVTGLTTWTACNYNTTQHRFCMFIIFRHKPFQMWPSWSVL